MARACEENEFAALCDLMHESVELVFGERPGVRPEQALVVVVMGCSGGDVW